MLLMQFAGLWEMTRPVSAAVGTEAGVLLAQPAHLESDRAAGVRVAMLAVIWDRWGPTPGVVDAAYRQAIVQRVQRYRSAGYRVSIDIGLQYPPEWVLRLPHGQLQDQRGFRSDSPNYQFNGFVRNAAESYIASVVKGLGPVWAYRVGLSKGGETLYPEAPRGQWWAFDAIAQGQAAGRPADATSSPMPGWIPGTASWRGRSVTVTQTREWYDWYLNASVKAHEWQVRSYRQAGFKGWLELVVPGTGADHKHYERRLAARLDDRTADLFHTMNTGAVWFAFLQRFKPRARIAVDISSVYDHSGVPLGNHCRVGDAGLDYTRSVQTEEWSSTRWLAYLSRRFKYLRILGESTGNNRPGTASPAFRLARSCGLTTMQWAWDDQLYDGVHVSIRELAKATAEVTLAATSD